MPNYILFSQDYISHLFVRLASFSSTTVIGTCDKPECPTKVCAAPCGEILSMENQGHYTHHAPKDADVIFIGQIDFNNDVIANEQSFVRSHPNSRRPVLGKLEMKELTEEDLKPNKLADSYSLANDLYDKL